MDESGPEKMPDLFPDFLPEVLNSFSPRSASFTVLIERERFINPFLKLLDSPGKNAEIP
jgi:hypothetical protein